MSEQLSDTPTHRWHILQASLDQVKADLEGIRLRRASVIEKIKKAKANSKVERALSVDKQLKNAMSKIERRLKMLEDDIATIEDDMNKARGLILEASDGEVALPKSGPTTNEEDKRD